MTNALAVIDLEFVICLFVITLPEIVVALKRLTKKIVTSELILIPAFLSYFIYAMTLIVKSPVEYSLYGTLFALFCLSAIMAAYLRSLADFESFRIISSAGDKKIVDNKYTRTLDEENMALDGVIDEYNSKTARMFRTVCQ